MYIVVVYLEWLDFYIVKFKNLIICSKLWYIVINLFFCFLLLVKIIKRDENWKFEGLLVIK